MSEQNTSNLDATPLYAMNPVDRFSDRVGDYVKYRPSYPNAAINRVLEGFLPPQTIAADIGAGTGIFTRQLLERDLDVRCLHHILLRRMMKSLMNGNTILRNIKQ